MQRDRIGSSWLRDPSPSAAAWLADAGDRKRSHAPTLRKWSAVSLCLCRGEGVWQGVQQLTVTQFLPLLTFWRCLPPSLTTYETAGGRPGGTRSGRGHRGAVSGNLWTWPNLNVICYLPFIISHLSSVICLLPSVVYRPSSIVYRLSSIVYRLPSIVYRLASFVCRLSYYVVRRKSPVVYRMSSIVNGLSSIVYRLSYLCRISPVICRVSSVISRLPLFVCRLRSVDTTPILCSIWPLLAQSAAYLISQLAVPTHFWVW